MEIFCRTMRASLAGRRQHTIACCMALCFCVMGCGRGTDVVHHAPFPPTMPREDISVVDIAFVPEADATLASPDDAVLVDPSVEGLSLRAEKPKKKCSVRHRFDRKALIAYEWGDNRLGLDVDGVNITNANVDAAMLKYRYRFSPDRKVSYKTQREKCRYASRWQGLIGSGYNEFFLREDDTVTEGISSFVDDLDNGVGNSF